MAHGIPLAAITTGGNRNDVTQLLPLIGAIPPARGLRGRPRQRPRHLYADRGYHHETYRDQVRALQITPHIARRGTEHGSELGVYRWVVENRHHHGGEPERPSLTATGHRIRNGSDR